MEMTILETIAVFFEDETGASAVEYGLLVALIAVVIIASVTLLGQTISNMFTSVSGAVSTAS
jgi:pilus assembly protein Flp/PilA